MATRSTSSSRESCIPIDTPDSMHVRLPAEQPRQTHAPLASGKVPGRHLDRRLGHLVATDHGKRTVDVPRVVEPPAKEQGREEFADDVPRRLRRLGAVIGIGIGHAFADSESTVLLDRDEEEHPLVHPPEAGFEEPHERQAQQAQFDAIDPHPSMLSQAPAASPSPRLRRASPSETGRPAPAPQVFSDCYTRWTLDFRYIAIEGPLGVGKSALADQLGARFDATVVLDETDNPFLADFYAERPGSGFQAQLFYTLGRHRQQMSLRQRDLFSQLTICDYLFERDKIYAYLNLDDNELFIYQRLYELLAPRSADAGPRDLSPGPDRRPAPPAARDGPAIEGDPPIPADRYVRELNEAYNHFFFHYTASPLLVVETSQFDLTWGEDAVADIERQIRGMGKGTQILRRVAQC